MSTRHHEVVTPLDLVNFTFIALLVLVVVSFMFCGSPRTGSDANAPTVDAN